MGRKNRTAFVLALGTLCSLVLVAGPGRTEVTSVVVGNAYLSPKVVFADPGTTVTFEWRDGRHRLVAYRTAFWDSGERSAPSTWSVAFDGGTVRYRCTLHATLDAAGYCNGMCGILTDDPHLDTREPSALILKPRRGEVITPVPDVDANRFNVRMPVTVQGSAWDNVGVAAVAVRFWDNAGRSFERTADCTGCTGPSVSWKVETSLLPGSYIIEAAAADAAGNRYLTPRQTFFVV